MSESELFNVSEEAVAEFRALMQDPASRQAFVTLKADQARSGTRARYDHILKAVSETPWAIRPSMLAVIVDILAMRAAGGRFSPEEIDARIGERRADPTQGPTGVAVVPLHGVIMPRATAMSEMSGGTSIDSFRAAFRDAMASSAVGAVVLDVDSPGGMVDQVPEMAAEIRAARGSKPIYAVANTEMASAAYWLASQADEVIASKSARVGSIGVVTVHEDHSKEQEAEGVVPSIISAGKYKAEGSPFAPLTDEARGAIQKMVDGYYGMFVNDVARGRKVSVTDVRDGFGQGRMESATDAKRLGLVDGIATLESVVSALLTATSSAPSVAASAPEPPALSVVESDTVTTSGVQGEATFTVRVPAPAPEPEPQPEPIGAVEDDAPEEASGPLAEERTWLLGMASRRAAIE